MGDVRGRCSVCPAELFQVGPLVAGQGTQPILLRTRPNQSPEWFGAKPIPYSRAVALPKARLRCRGTTGTGGGSCAVLVSPLHR